MELPQENLQSTIYPNPSATSMVIQFDLPEPADIAVVVHDVLGRRMLTPARQRLPKSPAHRLTLNVSHLPAGTYYYRLQAWTAGAILADHGVMVVTQ